MKSLIIAEKPSVARDLAQVLGKFQKVQDWFENDQYVISSAIGHLVELLMPEEIDPKLGFWRLQPLPIIPEKFGLKPIEDTKSKFQELKKLMARADVADVINGCDAGREGELIFTYIYDLAHCKKPVRRLWMQSMTASGIRDAFRHLRDDSEMVSLREAARCRSEADWLIGINGTRAITTRMFGTKARRGQVATVGRVQTPTLAMVVDREREIRAFKPRTFWRLQGRFSIAEGQYEGLCQRPDFRKSSDAEDKPERFWEAADPERILAAVQAVRSAAVTDEKKRTQQIAPRLFDLTTLQREANNRFGFSASSTLRITQSLYEKHKAITYPRTDSRALPEDYIPTCKDTLGQLASLYPLAGVPLANGWVRPNKRIFNNKEVSDHFAIIPTGTTGHKFTSDEERIFDMIARRFVAAFFPPAEYDVTIRLTNVVGYIFKTEGKVLAVPGWLEVYERSGSNGDQLPPLTAADGLGTPTGARSRPVSFSIEEDATRPPPRYTEATLLTAMETAGKLLEAEELAEAMKEKGLGTPATRASIIEHLLREKYLERDKKDLLPTTKAENLIDFLGALHADALTSPILTGEWEHRLRQMELGQLRRDQFMAGIIELTRTLVQRTKDYEEKAESALPTSVLSPTDQKPLLEYLRYYKSQDEQVTIYKTIANRKLELEEVGRLLHERRIGPLTGFRSKMGRPFTASLVLGEDHKIKFEFNNSGSGGAADGSGGESAAAAMAALDVTTLRVVGHSPLDNGPVYEAPNAYVCARAMQGDRTGFRLSRIMLGKTIPPEQVEKLLKERKTDLIEKFVSNRTKRPFDAFLTLDDKGKVGFAFPPRAAGAKTGGKGGRRGSKKKITRTTESPPSPTESEG